MKKIICASVLSLALILTACSSDDDNSNGTVTCEILGTQISIVDNGDGTATVTTDEGSETVDLDGVDFETFADGLCNLNIDFDL